MARCRFVFISTRIGFKVNNIWMESMRSDTYWSGNALWTTHSNNTHTNKLRMKHMHTLTWQPVKQMPNVSMNECTLYTIYTGYTHCLCPTLVESAFAVDWIGRVTGAEREKHSMEKWKDSSKYAQWKWIKWCSFLNLHFMTNFMRRKFFDVFTKHCLLFIWLSQSSQP